MNTATRKTTMQRLLAVAILAAGVIAILGLTVLPVWVANASRQATLDDLNERLERYEAIASRDKAQLPRYQALLARQRASGNHLRSETAALAGAELQRLVKSITAANKAQIVSTQLLPTAEEESFVRVTLKVKLRGTLPAVLESLYELETNAVYLFVDQLTLRDPLAGRAKPENRPMHAEFDLVAYMPEDA